MEKDKTVELPFGPPYQPIVSKPSTPTRRIARFDSACRSSAVAGEACSNLTVNGRRPDKPKFTITTKDGKEVESGAFEYG